LQSVLLYFRICNRCFGLKNWFCYIAVLAEQKNESARFAKARQRELLNEQKNESARFAKVQQWPFFVS